MSQPFKFAIVATALGVAACIPKPDTAPETPDTTDTCPAAAFADLVGSPADGAVAIPDPKRFIPPNSAVTTDYSPQRTNVALDDKGRIARIFCG